LTRARRRPIFRTGGRFATLWQNFESHGELRVEQFGEEAKVPIGRCWIDTKIRASRVNLLSGYGQGGFLCRRPCFHAPFFSFRCFFVPPGYVDRQRNRPQLLRGLLHRRIATTFEAASTMRSTSAASVSKACFFSS